MSINILEVLEPGGEWWVCLHWSIDTALLHPFPGGPDLHLHAPRCLTETTISSMPPITGKGRTMDIILLFHTDLALQLRSSNGHDYFLYML